MINTIYLDHEFNFLLLENTQEENSESTTKIYLNIKTDATTGQRLEISVAGGAVVTESIASDRIVKFELSPEYWADDNTTEITPKNDDITGDTITINFPKTFTTSAALNYISDTEFDIQAQNEDFAGGGGSGSGGSGGAAFDFVETIRNIGFRLLDEPSNVNAYFDEVAEEVQIKWTDPADIATNEPAPATWAGTVVVRKEGSAPLHRWDGVEIIDSTTRDEYSVAALIDNTIEINKSYYYGIFPYDTKGDYRFTKVVTVQPSETPLEEPQIVSLSVNGSEVTVNYTIPVIAGTYSTLVIVAKKNSAPIDKTDGKVVAISANSSSETVLYLNKESNYYFAIFAESNGKSARSNIESTTTGYITKLVETEIVNGDMYNKVNGERWYSSEPITAVYDAATNSMALTLDGQENFKFKAQRSRAKIANITIEGNILVPSGEYETELGAQTLFYTFLTARDGNRQLAVGTAYGDVIDIHGTSVMQNLRNEFHTVKTILYYNNGQPYEYKIYLDDNLFASSTFSGSTDTSELFDAIIYSWDEAVIKVKYINMSAVFIDE